MSTVDPRLADEGVQVARRANWLIGDDPNPEYFPREVAEVSRFTADIVLPRPVRADEHRTFGAVVQDPHGYHQIGRALIIVWSAVIIASALIGAGWLIGSGFITEMVNR